MDFGNSRNEMKASFASVPNEAIPMPSSRDEDELHQPNIPINSNRRGSLNRDERRMSLRRQSLALNAVINQRRALLGALISGMGSNRSLPSCIQQEQDLIHGQMNHGPTAQSNLTYDNHGKEQHHKSHEKHHPSMLQLTPVTTAVPPLSSLEEPDTPPTPPGCTPKQKHHAELMSTMSTLYAKLLVVVGVTVPVTASVGQEVPPALDQGFYLYLYLVSVGFVIMLYTTLMRDKAVKRVLLKHEEEKIYEFKQTRGSAVVIQAQQYGSFCLRLGAVGFGAGSLVFTGLQIGAEISSGAFRAATPAARLLLVTAQMHFIFLNSKDLELAKHGALAKLGLMHMIATNLCEWLQALIQETRHEIAQLEHAHGEKAGILATLLRDASPFLFPCTIEFSLICAVILFEMWKRVDEPALITNENSARSLHQLSIDCSSAHKGLFGGILVVAATVLSLIMFFVVKEENPSLAVKQVTAMETAILLAGLMASIAGAMKLRTLGMKQNKPPHLDATLLAAAQAGVYFHSFFGAVGSILTTGENWGLNLLADVLALIQSTIQTLVIKIAWRRRSTTYDKPGKELVTFLIVVNIALWAVNTLEKSRASVRPDHIEFFGLWPWTIITHVSMPLAIFFRFHSAICLFEVWKSCYKYKPPGQPQTPI